MGGKRSVKRTYVEQVKVIEVPMVGPDHSGGPAFCIHCHQSFLNGDHWRKVTRLGRGGITVGIHDVCRLQGQVG